MVSDCNIAKLLGELSFNRAKKHIINKTTSLKEEILYKMYRTNGSRLRHLLKLFYELYHKAVVP